MAREKWEVSVAETLPSLYSDSEGASKLDLSRWNDLRPHCSSAPESGYEVMFWPRTICHLTRLKYPHPMGSSQSIAASALLRYSS
jgi:hypothetical protein